MLHGDVSQFIGPECIPCRCLVDMRTSSGVVLSNILSMAMLVTVLASVVCYVLVGLKIRKVASQTARMLQNNNMRKCYRTGSIMMLFIAAYISQWTAYVVRSVWLFFGEPQDWVVISAVFMCNMGGVFNAIAYTILRRRLRKRSLKTLKPSPVVATVTQGF